MSSYTHFTLEERKYLQELLSQGYSFRKIATFLGRSPSSVSREVNRNKSKYPPKKKSDNKYRYNSWRAQILTIQRRRQKRRTAICKDTPVYNYVLNCLKQFWTPEQISNRIKIDLPGQNIAFTTIYHYVKAGLLQKIHPSTHLRRLGKNSNYVHHNSNVIHPDRLIPDWPDVIKARIRLGDWEGDTLYGGIGKGLLTTMVDRKSRCLRLGNLANRDAEKTKNAITKSLKGLPVNSISLDNGVEFAKFRELEQELNTLVYFAEPHKPWQRGTNENTNGILRFFFPKGYDFRTVTDEEIQIVENIINNRPRKCLGWKTPAEVFFEESVALD